MEACAYDPGGRKETHGLGESTADLRYTPRLCYMHMRVHTHKHTKTCMHTSLSIEKNSLGVSQIVSESSQI